MTNEAKQQLIVWWVLWAAFQTGILIIYQFLGNAAGSASSVPANSLIWLAGLGPVVVSTIVRWRILPRVQSAQGALPLFIMGIALAEATCFLGLFVFPAHKQELFVASALGIFQFIPFFAKRYFTENDPDSLKGPIG
jgi:hypothetical protein